MRPLALDVVGTAIVALASTLLDAVVECVPLLRHGPLIHRVVFVPPNVLVATLDETEKGACPRP